jgi:hypothetical protein
MATYTIRCMFAEWREAVVAVEAPDLETACALAVETANDGGAYWEPVDGCGDTFIADAALGQHDAPHYAPATDQLPIPYGWTERGTSGDIRNARELATVLAALRYWQRVGIIAGYAEHDIATDGDTHLPLTTDEIDALCERLNQ